jgi:hypothetical protein
VFGSDWIGFNQNLNCFVDNVWFFVDGIWFFVEIALLDLVLCLVLC